MIIYTIYRATNLKNSKTYIGFTSKDLEIRIAQHKKDYKRYNYTFYFAIRKYGWNNFYWEVLYQSKDGDHTKNVMERFFIEENNSFVNSENSNGYNMSLGGDGRLGYRHSEKSIALMKKNRKGIPCPEWQKEHLRKINTGKKYSPNRKSSAKHYSITSPEGVVYDIQNLTRFCTQHNLNSGAMSQVGQGKLPHHKGWKCARINDAS